MTASQLVRMTVLGLIGLLLLPWAVAQQTGQKGSGSNTDGSRSDAPKLSTGKSQSELSKTLRQNPQLLFITGMVVQEEGTPLPLGVIIERNCGGRVKREANVDSTGHFSFQIGGDIPSSNLLPEAADETMGGPGSFGNRVPRALSPGMDSLSFTNLMGCELRARLAGYRSTTVILQWSHTTGQLDVGTIVLHPIAKVPGTLVSVTNMQAPKAAKKALERAQKALQKKALQEAEKNLKTAIEVYPNYAAAWFGLGQVYQQQKRNQDARRAYGTALAIDSKYVSPYIQLAQLAGLEQKWQEMADITDRALALDPVDFPEGHFFNSLAYYKLNKLDAAERSALKAQRLDGLHRIPQVHLLLADILQQRQDAAGSIEQLRKYLKVAPTADNADHVRSRIQELERSSKALAAKQPEHQ